MVRNLLFLAGVRTGAAVKVITPSSTGDLAISLRSAARRWGLIQGARSPCRGIIGIIRRQAPTTEGMDAGPVTIDDGLIGRIIARTAGLHELLVAAGFTIHGWGAFHRHTFRQGCKSRLR